VAAALCLGRHATSIDDRDAHFETAASYKALANDVEWFRGERQRLYKRKKKALDRTQCVPTAAVSEAARKNTEYGRPRHETPLSTDPDQAVAL
jgi:hypothetical protein